MHYMMHHCILDARATSLPVRRKRLWMIAVQSCHVPGDEMSDEGQAEHAFRSKAQALVERHTLSCPPSAAFEDFLIDCGDSDDAMAAWWPETFAGIANNASADSCSFVLSKADFEQRWPAEHEAMWAAIDVTLEDRCAMHEAMCGNNFFMQFPTRQRDSILLKMCEAKGPNCVKEDLQRCPGGRQDRDREETVWDIKHSTSRITAAHGGMVCLLPASRVWLQHRKRSLAGAESLALQGADLRRLRALRPGIWSSKFLQDLGGNAFCNGHFLVAFSSGLLLL